MQTKTFAHLSDLHLGRSEATLRAAERLVAAMATIDHVIVTGDVTHRGRASEWALFLDVFAPLLEAGRVTLVPGNHDRLGDDVAQRMMRTRVAVDEKPGLYLVRVDSTAPHNRFLVAGHGAMCERVIAECEAALDAAPSNAVRAVLLHHHVLPAPVETLPEKLADLVALPFANELQLGGRLLARLVGRADLVLHGHRHTPRAVEIRPAAAGAPRAERAMEGSAPDHSALGVYNAGSSTELGAARVFTHAAGRLVGPAHWLRTEVPREPALHDLARGVDGRAGAVHRPARRAHRASA